MNDDILNLYKSIGSIVKTQQQQQQQQTIFNSKNSSSQPSTSTNQNQVQLNSNSLILQNATTSATILPVTSSSIANRSIGSLGDTLSIDTNKSFNLKRPFNSLTSESFIQDNILMMKRKREKCSKGLRHFSMKVCEKVKQKGVTTYNEVADELVNEYCGFSPSFHNTGLASALNPLDYWSYDQKNVRRRVYDALNVLMAMNIISKEKKEIKWIGLPCNKKQECQDLEIEKRKIQESILVKSEHLKDLILEQIALKNLIERNKKSEANSNDKIDTSRNIKVPFVVLSTDKKTQIDCTISNDRREYLIQFDNTFEINSYFNILKRLNLTIGADENSKLTNENSTELLPKLFEPYLKQLATSTKLEPICIPFNLPNYGNLLNYEKDVKNNKTRQNNKSSASNKSSQDAANESSNYDEDEQLSNEEMPDSDDQDENSTNYAEQNSDEENSSDNDDENSLADSLSF